MNGWGRAGIAVVVVVAAAAAWVRLAPSDPGRWHVDPGQGTAAPGAVVRGRGEARAAVVIAAPPEAALARADAVAMATPRTRRLAGSPAEGRITWVTRSALWGFPDYTTAAARPDPAGTRIDLHARLRFGGDDLGVNARRLEDWLARLGGLNLGG